MYEIYKDIKNGFILKCNGEFTGCYYTEEEAIEEGERNSF